LNFLQGNEPVSADNGAQDIVPYHNPHDKERYLEAGFFP
jgi:hypothetical protein